MTRAPNLKKDLEDILSKQFLILQLLSEKIQIVNYLIDNLTASKTPFLFQNHFFIFTTHIYLRSAIIDIGALVIDRKIAHKNNFHRLYQNQDFATTLTKPVAAQIKSLLVGAANEIKVIHEMRDTAMAHYDLTTTSLKFETTHLPIVNTLRELCNEIIKIAGLQIGVEYCFQKNNFESLQRLVKDTDHLEKGRHQ